MTLNVCTLQLILSTLMRRQLVRWPILLRQICSQIANTMQNSKTYKTAIISLRLQEMRQIFGETLFPKSFFDPKPKLQFSIPQKLRYVDQDCLQAVLKKKTLHALEEWQTLSCTEKNTLQCSEVHTINNNFVKSPKWARITMYKI